MIPQMEETLKTVIGEQRQGMEGALTEYSKKVEPILRNLKEATESLVSAAVENDDSITALGAQLKILSESFELARSSWERIDSLMAGVGEACANAISTGLQEFSGELEQNDEERAALRSSVSELQRTLRRTLEKLQEDRSAAQERATEVLETTRDVMTKGLDRMLTSLQQGQNSNKDDFVHAIRELTREIRDLSKPPPEYGGDSRESSLEAGPEEDDEPEGWG